MTPEPTTVASPGELWLSLRDDYAALEAKARDVLDPLTFDFVTSGPNHGSAVDLYCEAFSRRLLRPRALPPVGAPDLTIELLGRTYDCPIMIAPTGFIANVHPEAELAIARAAASSGVAMMCSTYTAKSLESISGALGDAACWFQLYWAGERKVVSSLLEEAERCGCVGVAVTVDTAALPMRPEAMLASFSAQLETDHVHGSQVRSPTDPDVIAERTLSRQTRNPTTRTGGLTADELRWICAATALPVVAKGVLSGESARELLDCGVAGLIVSNHGGQLLDSSIPSLDALEAVRAVAGPDVPVMLDSGIRTGSDVAKALALGADAVLVGRPCLLGLAVSGETGVRNVLNDLIWDLRVVLANLGCTAAVGLDSSYVVEQHSQPT